MLNKIVEKSRGWELALADAEAQIAEAKKQAAQRRATATMIRRMIKDGGRGRKKRMRRSNMESRQYWL